MSKQCIKCQTMNDDTATVCQTCGTSFYAAPSGQVQQYSAAPAPQNNQQYSQPQDGYGQPQAPGQPYQQQQYSQPQSGYGQPQAPGQPYQQQPYNQSQYGYGQAPVPVINKIKPLTLMLIIAGVVALVVVVALLLIPRNKVDITDPPISDTEDVTEDVGDEEKKEEKEEEGEKSPVADPDFLKTLESGVYGYDMRYAEDNGDEIIEVNGFVYSDKSRIVLAFYGSNGSVQERMIYDYGTKESWYVDDSAKKYYESSGTLFIIYGVPDFSAGKTQIDSGTADCNGEKLDYIDYDLSGNKVRVFLKGGSIYAMQTSGFFVPVTYYLQKTYSSPPTTEYFEIPNNYQLSDW